MNIQVENQRRSRWRIDKSRRSEAQYAAAADQLREIGLRVVEL